jgi:zinc protease
MGSEQLNIASLPGPHNIARRVFDNGVVGLAWENTSSPSVIVHGWLHVGSVEECAEQAGLAGLTASLLTHGTERRTSAQIGQEIESLGASLHIHSGDHLTSLTIKCLNEDLDLLLDILVDCLCHPTFPPDYVEKRKGEVLTAIQQREHNTELMAMLRFHEMMYPHHPYGQSQLGYQETIERLERADIEGFYREHYGAEGMGVVIVGAIPQEQGLDKLQEAMGRWRGQHHQQVALPQVPPIDTIRQRYTVIPGKTQSDIVLGWIGLKRQDPDFLSAYLANSILGQFGMMGRIGEHVRDEKGLAYYAYSTLEAGFEAGPWAMIAGVAPEDVSPAIDAILAEIRRLQHDKVPEQELADNKAHIVNSLPLRLETKEGIAVRIAHMELYQLGLDYLQRLPALIEALGTDDVMAVAQRLANPEAYVLSVAGPSE